MVSFILNGSEVSVAEDHPHLLAALAEREGVSITHRSLARFAPVGFDERVISLVEVITAVCDLDLCADYKRTVFDFDRYRRPEMYTRITAPRGRTQPDETRP